MNTFLKIAPLVLGVVLLSTFLACENKSNTNTDTVRLIPLEDFFKNPEKTNYKISPEGTHFSFLAPYENRLNLFVQKIGEKEGRRITAETDRNISNYFWANNNRIAFLKDEGGDENFFLVAVDRDGKNEKPLTKFDKVKTQIIDDLEDDEKHVIVGLNRRNPQIFDAYRLNIETGEMEIIAKNPGDITGWITDHDGKLRIALVTDGVNNRLLYRKTEKDKFEALMETNFKDQFSPLFFTFDNKNLYATSNLSQDKSAVVIFDLATGKIKEELYKNEKYDVAHVTFSRKEKKLIRAVYYSWKGESYYFSEEAEKIAQDIKAKVKKDFVIVSSTREEDRYVLYTYSDRSQGDYYVYDKNTSELTHIANVAPWINEDEMAEMTPIQYTSRDGLTINGYLTLPVGQTKETAKNLPVVVNPHGGPWARDGWGYSPEIQFLANRGYAVFNMNFRGSLGYGKEFWKASFKQWGLKMQDDITDGVNWLIQEGIADSARIGIYGGSYGGYATLAGLVSTPDLYACGIDYVGVSNLFTFMKSIPPYWEHYLDMLYEQVGDPSNEQDSLQMVATSPVLNADKITSPMFVVQGANDPRVAKSESDQMVEAMRKRGVEVEYMVKDNEGHGFVNEENRFDFYRAMEKFLAKHLGGKAAPPQEPQE